MTRLTRLTKPLSAFAALTARDRSGSISVMAALSLTALVGFAGLGTEVGFWYVKQQQMQSAADTAAFTAAEALKKGETIASGTPQADARAVAATYGYFDHVSNMNVDVHSPPQSGPYASNSSAIEVIINGPSPRLFSALFMNSNPIIGARAVAVLSGGNGTPCVMALNEGNVNDLTVSGNPTLNIPGCDLYVNSSNATNALNLSGTSIINAKSTYVVGGLKQSGTAQLLGNQYLNTGSPEADPFADASFSTPPGCDQTNWSQPGATTINPGVYCGGMTINSGAVVTMNPGVYYINGGSFKINGGGTLTGDGVTIVLTGSAGSYSTVTINGGAVVTLNETTPGPIDGLAFFQDRNAPVSNGLGLPVNTFNGDSNMNINGGIYFPNQLVKYSGGAETGGAQCTQLIGYMISITGETNFSGNCTDVTGKTDSSGGTQSVALVE
jgi:Putative Flp pilus-assembly TadE/G-like